MKHYLIASLSLATYFLMSVDVHADKVCLKVKKNLRVQTRQVQGTVRCPRGFKEVVNTTTLSGPKGATGPTGATGSAGVAGADGALRVWGDGSGGALNITSASPVALDTTLQFTNIMIAAGANATVPDGAILRCTGTATINGTISVRPGEGAGIISISDGIATAPAGKGGSERAAGAPAVIRGSSLGSLATGGAGGFSELVTNRHLGLRPRPGSGGGAGHGGYNFFDPSSPSTLGSRGGGAFGIYCRQGIVLGASGVIAANGEAGGESSGLSIGGTGGGAGGFILLASSGSINSLGGTVQALGGDGGDPVGTPPLSAAGGGGAGGFIYLIAPSISAIVTQVSGGSGGAATPANTFTGASYAGGGGGGAIVSRAGDGGAVATDLSSSAGSAGESGVSTEVYADPTALLLQ